MAEFIRRLNPDYRIPVFMFLGFLILRIPFRSEFLVNWDAANFALGTQSFNLENHQPHPPGYIGYIAAGWVLNHVTGDANTSLTILSVLSGAAAPVAFFLLAALLIPWRYAVISAILFGLSPVVWYYSEVALTYSVELALGLFFLWAGYKARLQHSFRHIVIATVLLVLLGSMRQSGAMFLMPLWLYFAWPFAWNRRIQAGTLLVIGNLVWFVPLIWLSGGIVPYMKASRELAGLAVMPTSIFTMNPIAMTQNFSFVLAGIIVGVNLGLVVIAMSFMRNGPPTRMFTSHRAFFALWLVPMLVIYLLMHVGQLGYVLLLLPPIFLLVGSALQTLDLRASARSVRHAAASGGRKLAGVSAARGYAAISVIAVLAVANAGAFFYAPGVVHTLATADEKNAPAGFTGELFEQLPLFRIDPGEGGRGVAQRARQYDIKRNDRHWNELVDLVQSLNPAATAVLTVPDGGGSFRHFTYYLPKYHVYGFGRALDNSYGHLFSAFDGTSDYTIEGLKTPRRELTLPPDVTVLVIPDKDITDRLWGINAYEGELPGGGYVAIALVPAGTTLNVKNVGDSSAWIRTGKELALQSTPIPAAAKPERSRR